MAWSPGSGGRQYRKDASASQRSNVARTTLFEEGRPGKRGHRKRPPCASRKYGIEYKPKPETMVFLRSERDWQHHFNWYETPKQRDQALEALIRKCRYYDYRAIDRS